MKEASQTTRRGSRLGAILKWTAPLAFALSAPLFLLARNSGEIAPSAAERAIVASLGLGCMSLTLTYLVFRSRDRAVVMGSAIMIAVFFYGHAYDGLKELGPLGITIARHRHLVPSTALLLLGLAFLLIRKPTAAPGLAQWLTLWAWILLLFPAAPLVRDWIRDRTPDVPSDVPGLDMLQASPDGPPDVFYVVLDGYGREDVLQDSYGYDNSAFVDFLASRGFYVADKAMSNYSRTLLSLSSSLNMEYLDKLLGPGDLDRNERRFFTHTLSQSRVFSMFRGLGYSIVAFETGYHATELKEVDLYLAPDRGGFNRDQTAYTGIGLNEFEGLLVGTTIARAVFDVYLREIQRRVPGLIDYEYDMHRRRVLFTVSSLSEIVSREEPQFVFAHIVSPHPPFVFGPRGEPIAHEAAFSLLGDSCCQGNDYIERYVGQMRYLNEVLEAELDEILEASDGNVIIVLQGDHGPAALLDWNNPSGTGIRDRMAILNAYHFPGAADEALYPSISPVNTFRVIADMYFGGEFGLTEDSSYFTSSLRLTDAVPVPPV